MTKLAKVVVVVDDNAGILKSVARFLSLHGFEVRMFNSAEALIDSGDVEAATCLLLDINLGTGMSGIDLQRLLAASGSKCPVIFMTATDDNTRSTRQWRQVALPVCKKGERPYVITQQQRDRLLALGPDLISVWNASTTTPRDRKELLRTLIDEVIVKVERDAFAAHLTLRWKGGALTEIDLDLPRSRPATIRTDEDTVALLRRLAVHYPDAMIAGILNRQGRRTAYGHRFDRNRVGNLRRYWNIPSFPEKPRADGDLMSIRQAAVALGVAPSTIHRLLSDGIIAGEQLTPGASWRIRLTDEPQGSLQRRSS